MRSRTYELVQAPSPAMEWDQYRGIAESDLHTLLDSGECDEQSYQVLLERHPSLVPAAHPAIDAGHHGLFPGAVITKAPLTGLVAKIPDFAAISFDSGTTYVALVEIESPCKSWSTGKGKPREELVQAIQQLRDWRIWFDTPGNQARFLDEYRIPSHLHRPRAFRLKCVLVYGRRSDLESSGFQKTRTSWQGDDETFMSWDRLSPGSSYSRAMTVRLTGSGYVAVHVPPTVTLGPLDADDHAHIRGKEDAVMRSELMPIARREFMRDRWAYWDQWAKRCREAGHFSASAGDFE